MQDDQNLHYPRKSRKSAKGFIVISGMALWMLAGSAGASDYGCQVLLCLSNPGGPTQYAECQPPINRLWDDLENGRPFPTCEQAGNGAYAQQLYTHYDPCPEGMQSLDSGINAVTQAAIDAYNRAAGRFYYGGGDPRPQPTTSSGENGEVCYQGKGGTVEINYGDWGDPNVILLTIFQKLRPGSKRYMQGNAIDVYIDSKLYKRVHW